jgi:HSP20 family protein
MMLIIRRTAQRDPDRVQQEMEQVFRSLMPQRPHVATRRSDRWRPPVEVYETDEALIVTAEIAGVNERDLSVVIDHDVLSIRGERTDDRGGERRSYRETGIAFGPFGVDVYIPFAVDAERTDADYANGFLRIRLPRASAKVIVPRTSSPAAERGQGA